MKNLSNLLNRISNWKTLLAAFIIYMFFNGYLLKNAEEKINDLSGKTIGVIDLTFGFDAQKTLDMVAAYSDEARDYYAQTELITDVIYPIVYSLFFGIILTLLFKGKSYSPHRLVNILPFFSLLFDYLENSTIVYLLNNYPTQSQSVAILCEIFKLLKWLSFGLVIALILYGLVKLLLVKLSPSKPNN
ncbi:MAG: hypothetical protein V4683_15120 [Bacteroidota bacterium]